MQLSRVKISKYEIKKMKKNFEINEFTDCSNKSQLSICIRYIYTEKDQFKLLRTLLALLSCKGQIPKLLLIALLGS